MQMKKDGISLGKEPQLHLCIAAAGCRLFHTQWGTAARAGIQSDPHIIGSDDGPYPRGASRSETDSCSTDFLRAITAVVPLLARSANYQISPSPQIQQMSLYVTDSISGGNLGLCSVYDRNRCTQGPQSLTTLCDRSLTPFQHRSNTVLTPLHPTSC